MSVLILGGTGFLGSAAAISLSEQNLSVRVLCRRPPPATLFGHARVAVYLREIATLVADDPVFDQVDTVLHFISTTTPASSMKDVAFDVSSNLLPVLNLLQILEQRKIQRLVYASSGGTVYGIPARLPAAEEDPTNPICAHGITKLATEKFIGLQARLTGLNAIILRIGNPFGPYQLRGVTIGSIARFVQQHANSRKIHIWGDGSVMRDYLYIDDFCRILSRIVETKDFPSGVYNVGSGAGHTLLEVLDEIKRVSGHPPNVSFEPGRSVDVPAVVLDTNRLRQNLPEWKPQITFSDGIERMWRAALDKAGMGRQEL
jgi:UDP-glucose 4-epimerase